MKMELNKVSNSKFFGGWQQVYSHESQVLGCKMNFGIYIPPQAESAKVPVIYWLSGLTCTEQNFITKSGVQQFAAKHGVIIVAPDTSPRGCGIVSEDDSWDFGTGAGFYVDATEEKWKKNYRMYSYITSELPQLIQANFPAERDRQSVMGHSMGGHGALICYLKNPGLYRSVSAFSPICNPTQCPWGQKAFLGYLGNDKASWEEYDACSLTKFYSGPLADILIDQGSDDEFLHKGQLLPNNFVSACAEAKIPIVLRMQDGYDHSYNFIATFIGDHIAHHAKYLSD
jgi:S-formylglutathione hydrolase